MTDFDRRKFLAVASAGAALAGCSQAAKGKVEGHINVDSCKGVPALYGDDPHDKISAPFDPDFIGMVYIKPTTGWTLSVNHAAFRLPSKMSDDQRAAHAIKLLKNKGQKFFRDLKGADAPYGRTDRITGKPNKFDSENFDEYFGFTNPNELFIYIEGPGVTLNRAALLSFTPYDANRSPRDPNFSFYGAEPVTITDPSFSGKLIRVRNYMTDKDRKPIGSGQPTTGQKYSMNIHFFVPGTGGKPIPIIIDPDTGNGQGNEPLFGP